MNPRTTGIVFVLAAALFAFIYFYEIRGEERRREAEEVEKQLFSGLEADAIRAIELRGDAGDAIRLERREGRWQIVEPLAFPADEFAADAMAAALADLSSEAVYADPQAPDVYGLGEGARELAFEVEGESHRVRIGDKTPMGSNTYVSTGEGAEVYAVTSFAVNALRKELDDLREKRVARFDVAAVDRVEATWRGGGRVVLARGEEGWRLLEPIAEPADETTIDALLTDLSFLRATGFEDAPAPDAETGLDAPAFAVHLTGVAGEGEEEAAAEALDVRIAVGDPVDDDSRLVRAAAASLYRIPAERIEDFPRNLVAYRFKDLARFPQADARRVEVAFERLMSSDEGDAPLEIVATRGETGWSAEPEDFRPGKLASLVSELSRLRAEDILADAAGEAERAGLGLAPPRARIRVFGEGDEPLADLRIGVVRGDGQIVAQAADDPRVFALAAEVGEYLPVSLEAFRNRFQREAEPQEPDAEAPLPLDAELPSPSEESP